LLQNSSNLVLNTLVDSAGTTPLGRLFHIWTTLSLKKNLCKSYLVPDFVILNLNLKLPLVVGVVDVVR